MNCFLLFRFKDPLHPTPTPPQPWEALSQTASNNVSTKHEHQFWTCILNVSAVKEPKLEFIPNKQPIYVLQGKSGEVTCAAELPSISTLKWEKQQNDKSYAAVPNSLVNITEDAKYVRATLKITNAQFADTGTYKCTVQYPPTKSKHKETKITVLGRLALLYSIVTLQLIAFYLQHSQCYINSTHFYDYSGTLLIRTPTVMSWCSYCIRVSVMRTHDLGIKIWFISYI